jgi:hypothetical protein
MKKAVIVHFIIFSIPILLVTCSMPSDSPAPSWRSAVDLPLSNLRFIVADYLNNDKIIDPDSASNGDTMTLRIDQSDSAVIEKQIVNLKKNTLEQKIGAIEIRNSSDVEVGFGFPFSGSVPVAGDVPLSATKPAQIKRVYKVLFDSSTPKLPVHIYNNSKELPVSNLHFSIINEGTVVAAGDVASLNPMDSAAVDVSLAGKGMDSLIDISLSTTINGGPGRNSQPNDSISLRFNLDGQKIAAATISDSLLKFSKEYTKQLEMSDTLEISYIDFDTTELSFAFSSPTNLQLGLQAELRHLWDISFADQRGIQSERNLGTISKADSLRYYRGIIFNDTITAQQSNGSQTGAIRFNTSRMLCRWDTVAKSSVGDYVYHTTIIPRGAKVSFHKDSMFKFEMTPLRFPFVSLKGTLRQPLSDTIDGKSMALNLPIEAGTLLDKVRGKLLFSSFSANGFLQIMLPPKSWIDSAKARITVGIPDSSSHRTSEEAAFTGRSDTLKDTLHYDLTSLLNQFPDSLRVEGDFRVPAGTELLIHNKRDAGGRYSNSLSMRASVIIRASLPFVWSVRDTVVALLDNSTFKVREQLKIAGKMNDASIMLNMAVTNQTNLQATLYALGAPKEFKNDLFSLTEESVDPSILATAKGQHFFQLLGDEGIVIPARGDEYRTQIGMGPSDTKKFLSSDTCYFRWRLRLPKKSADALHDTDYVAIRSSIHVSGIMNADSLWGW